MTVKDHEVKAQRRVQSPLRTFTDIQKTAFLKAEIEDIFDPRFLRYIFPNDADQSSKSSSSLHMISIGHIRKTLIKENIKTGAQLVDLGYKGISTLPRFAAKKIAVVLDVLTAVGQRLPDDPDEMSSPSEELAKLMGFDDTKI